MLAQIVKSAKLYNCWEEKQALLIRLYLTHQNQKSYAQNQALGWSIDKKEMEKQLKSTKSRAKSGKAMLLYICIKIQKVWQPTLPITAFTYTGLHHIYIA